MNLPQRFEETLKKSRFLKEGSKVFVACSGGPDSVALASLLSGLQSKWHFRLALIHVNHQLRGKESLRDERFVYALGKTLKIPVYSGKVKIQKNNRHGRWSLEEAARQARYDFFQKTGRRYRVDALALAHTLDDQAETVLMRVLNGTGLRGLLGIRPQRRMGKLCLVRPLLDFSKHEILNYLKRQKIRFVKDSSNRSMRFMRNRIRGKLLPLIQKEINPRAVQALARLPVILNEELHSSQALEEIAWKQAGRKSSQKGKFIFRRDFFLECPAALQFRLLDRALKVLNPASGIQYLHWQKLRPQLSQRRLRISLPKGIDLILNPKSLFLMKIVKS